MVRQSRTAAARRSAAARRTDTDDPSRSRERALRVLFQADVRGVAPSVTLARLDDDPAARALLDERDVLTEGEPVLPPPTSDERSTSTSAGAAGRDRGVGAGAGTGSGATRGAGGGTGRSGAGGGVSVSGKGAAGASGWSDAPAETDTAPLDGFTRSLVQGVEDHRVEVEGLIARYARRWAISRMPVVDRNVLRLATYELLHEPTPHAVVLDEAIGLAKRLSTDDSGRFVNGVLESIRQQLAAEAAEAAEAEDAGDAAHADVGNDGIDAGSSTGDDDGGDAMVTDDATDVDDATDAHDRD